MSENYTQSREVGKQIGKFCSKIINVTGSYLNIAYNSVSAGYDEFRKETGDSVKNFSNKEDINVCVDKELKEKKKKEDDDEVNEEQI